MTENKIIFVANKKDASILKEYFSETDTKIITFDIEAHQELKKNGIEHLLLDNYFKKKDYELIDNITIKNTLNWHKEYQQSLLEFNELNIGNLIQPELELLILTNVRNLIGIERILEKENPDLIILSSLTKLAEEICFKKKIVMKDVIDETFKLKEDEIVIPFFKNTNIKLSKQKYLKIKKNLDLILEKFFKLNFEQKNHEKSILLLDFNVVFFEKLITEISLNFENLVLLNQRRPAIWNKESLNIIKKTNSKILTLEKFLSNEVKLEIQHNQKNVKENIEIFFNEPKLKEYFSHNGNSFWNAMKGKFMAIAMNRSSEMVYIDTLIKIIFEKFEFGKILEWADSAFEEKIIIHNARKNKIPIVILQHSIISQVQKYDKFIPFQPTIPSLNSKIAVYGETTKKFLLSKNVPENKILVTGSPRHDDFFKSTIKNYKNSILIATTSASSIYNSNGRDIKSYEKWEKSIEIILKSIKKYSDKKPIIKLHPSKEFYEIQSFIKKIDDSIPIYKDIKPNDLLNTCDLLIVTNVSTILLEAMILKKPTILISTQDQNTDEEIFVKNNATLYVQDLESIEKSIKKILTDIEFRNKLIKNADKLSLIHI